MYAIHQSLLAAHIFVGAVALASFWVPVFARKGSPWHVKAGMLYSRCMIAVAWTAIALCAVIAIDPLGSHGVGAVPPERAAEIVSQSRLFGAFLAFLGLTTLSGIRNGLRAVKARREPGWRPTRGDVTLDLAVVASGVAMLIMGLVYRNPLFIGLSLTVLIIRLMRVRRATAQRFSWWSEHLSAMLGTGIGAYTAFFVFGGRRLFSAYLPGGWELLPWFLPTVIGVPAISLTIRYYRARFEPAVRPAPAGAGIDKRRTLGREAVLGVLLAILVFGPAMAAAVK
jgi:hypothetical protein